MPVPADDSQKSCRHLSEGVGQSESSFVKVLCSLDRAPGGMAIASSTLTCLSFVPYDPWIAAHGLDFNFDRVGKVNYSACIMRALIGQCRTRIFGQEVQTTSFTSFTMKSAGRK